MQQISCLCAVLHRVVALLKTILPLGKNRFQFHFISMNSFESCRFLVFVHCCAELLHCLASYSSQSLGNTRPICIRNKKDGWFHFISTTDQPTCVMLCGTEVSVHCTLYPAHVRPLCHNAVYTCIVSLQVQGFPKHSPLW